MIKFDKNEFLKPQIYSTLDEYESRCNVTKEVIEEIVQLQQENEQLKDNWNMLKEHLKNRYDNGTESIIYRQVFMEIREAMQVLEITQELEKGDSNE